MIQRDDSYMIQGVQGTMRCTSFCRMSKWCEESHPLQNSSKFLGVWGWRNPISCYWYIYSEDHKKFESTKKRIRRYFVFLVKLWFFLDLFSELNFMEWAVHFGWVMKQNKHNQETNADWTLI